MTPPSWAWYCRSNRRLLGQRALTKSCHSGLFRELCWMIAAFLGWHRRGSGKCVQISWNSFIWESFFFGEGLNFDSSIFPSICGRIPSFRRYLTVGTVTDDSVVTLSPPIIIAGNHFHLCGVFRPSMRLICFTRVVEEVNLFTFLDSIHGSFSKDKKCLMQLFWNTKFQRKSSDWTSEKSLENKTSLKQPTIRWPKRGLTISGAPLDPWFYFFVTGLDGCMFWRLFFEKFRDSSTTWSTTKADPTISWNSAEIFLQYPGHRFVNQRAGVCLRQHGGLYFVRHSSLIGRGCRTWFIVDRLAPGGWSPVPPGLGHWRVKLTVKLAESSGPSSWCLLPSDLKDAHLG